MAANRVSFIALLLFATILVGFNMEHHVNALLPVCITRRIGYYMTCPSTGSEHLEPPCYGCGQAAKGCKIFDSTGSLICKAT